MNINSLSMSNFQCYFGTHDTNLFEFEEGLNLVIGDNGAGKSKFFDAFYWVLHDKIFSSDRREFISTKIYQDRLVSDKAKNECEVGGKIQAEVILNASDSRGKEYKFTRVYGIEKIDDMEWKPNSASTLMIEEMTGNGWKLVEPTVHSRVLNRLIPSHMEPYMWFQGEQVDSLMDFKDKSTLENAINILSNITIYDDMIRIAEDGAKKSETKYLKEQKKLITDKGKAEESQRQLDKIKTEIKKVEGLVASDDENLNSAKLEIEELVSQIDDATKKAELKTEVSSLEEQIGKDSKDLEEEFNSLNKRIFNENWLLRNSSKSLKKFSVKYKSYINNHTLAVNAATLSSTKLPIDIPQPVYVDNMLSDEKCYVCGREAKTGSDAYGHIKSLLERKAKSKDIFKDDCDEYFRTIYENALKCNRDREAIDQRISDTFKRINDLKLSISTSKERIQQIRKSFESLLEQDRSEDIVKAFRTHEVNRETYQALLETHKRQLESAITEKERILSQLKKMTVGELDNLVDLTKNIFSQLLEITTSTREGVFQELIGELQHIANSLFEQMTRGNPAITGQIQIKKIGKDNYIPEIVDNEGNVMTGLNDSNIILVKLSLIMAIILSRGKVSENFSLILDAPTSKMAENYTYGFYRTMGSSFKQCIVATYDFSDNFSEVKSKVSDFKVGSIYRLSPRFPGGDKTDRSDLSVEISRVSL